MLPVSVCCHNYIIVILRSHNGDEDKQKKTFNVDLCVFPLRVRTGSPCFAPGAVFPQWSVSVYAHGHMHESDSKACFLSCALQSVTLTEGKKRGLLWHTQLEASPGGVRVTHRNTHTKKKQHTHTFFPIPPVSSLCCFDDAREASQHGGAPLEPGTDGQSETTHWSWLTTFLHFFAVSFSIWNRVNNLFVVTF